jgi:hypothetical protein
VDDREVKRLQPHNIQPRTPHAQSSAECHPESASCNRVMCCSSSAIFGMRRLGPSNNDTPASTWVVDVLSGTEYFDTRVLDKLYLSRMPQVPVRPPSSSLVPAKIWLLPCEQVRISPSELFLSHTCRYHRRDRFADVRWSHKAVSGREI